MSPITPRPVRRARVALRRAANEGEGERGATLVEFALILPVFVILLLGMVTGGLAYNQKLTVTASAREAARFAATKSGAATSFDTWADSVRDVAVASADGELDPGDSGRYLCVAYVPSGSPPAKREYLGSAAPVTTVGARCFDDGTLSDRRVQVVARRTAKLEALVFSQPLNLSSQGVSRYEAIP